MSPRIRRILPCRSRGITEWDLIYVLGDRQMIDLRDGQRQRLVDVLVIRAKKLHRRG